MKNIVKVNTTGNTFINRICKRDTIVAIATKNNDDGSLGIGFEECDTIRGLGHYDCDDGICLWAYELNGSDEAFDVLLSYENWDFSVEVKFQKSS